MTAQLFDFPAPAPILVKGKKPPKSQEYTAEFEAFWTGYPRKLNCSKFEAFKSWLRLPSTMQAQAIAVLPTFAAGCAGKDEQYICHAATWLNQRRFETVVVTRAAVPAVPAAPVDWPKALQIFQATGRWNPDLGPEPGHKNYRGPVK